MTHLEAPELPLPQMDMVVIYENEMWKGGYEVVDGRKKEGK